MAPSAAGYNFNDFESHWETLDEDARARLIAQASSLSPSLGILPVMEGINSFHFKVRASARKGLAAIQNSLQQQLNTSQGTQSHGEDVMASAMVSARIYRQIRPEIPLNDMGFFLKTLLGLGEKGAYFAFKAVCLGNIPPEVLKKLISFLDPGQRLMLVDQYLLASPGIRVKFAPLFQQILNSVTHRQPILEFYAGLFDRKRDADPFLNNIRFELRNPDFILEQEMASPSLAVKIMGLKALSLMMSKIPLQLLAKSMEIQADKKLRLAVYTLIENSAMGLYSALFDPILTHFYQCDRDEAVPLFKALIATGKLPVHTLFKMIRDEMPEVLPDILCEIACLSRISFFVIQDLALNKEKYRLTNFDINMACVWGMVQKRPERVVKILRAYKDHSGRGMNREMIQFMEKIRELLGKEKEHIESFFTARVAQLQNRVEKPKNFFAALFPDPLQKKIQALTKKNPLNSLDFQQANFQNENLSGRTFSAFPLFFNQASFENCDLSNSVFIKAYFKQTLFYNVNMDNTLFDAIAFDNAVFINVSAQNAMFKNCSFQGARLFNCSFNQADMTDSLFINATISKTAFDGTHLSCASFAHARISGVSFATAHLDMADFSGVQARFSRFPSHAFSLFSAQGIDTNYRHYQLAFTDLPPLEAGLISEINCLIFCEFIHYGEKKFLDQNKLSVLTAYDIFKPAQADLFTLIPLLIHENLEFSDFGQVPENTPCGLAHYLPEPEAVSLCEKYAGKNKFKARRSALPQIQGLFTMGSVGSLAQTFESDIDYWVCIHQETMESQAFELLQRKLRQIETLAWEKFKTRITFFLVDIQKARNNDFGDSTLESSGTAQSRLLKEEFYRTMIHVAGKLPLWAVLPTAISLNYYHMILDQTSKSARFQRYIDLGDIHAIPVNEYFGASMWQMFKWLESPFKSVLKMALLEKYIHTYGKEPLLCNQYKNEWMNSGSHLNLAQNDSYMILLNHLIAYYHHSSDTPSANLVLICFFMKLEISKQEDLDNTLFGLRKILVDKCLKSWKWDRSRLFEIGRFKQWPYARIQRLSLTLEQFMQSKYTRIKKYFETQSRAGAMISNQDRSVLERKVDIVFLEKPFKIKKMLLVSRGDRHFARLSLNHIPGEGWELLHKDLKTGLDHGETLVKTRTLEEIGAWLVHNRLYTDNFRVNLIPNPTRVSHDDIQKLYKSLYDFFIPDLEKPVRFSELHNATPFIISAFISINFYAPKQQTSITDCCVIHLNSWGEMYARSAWPQNTFPTLEIAKKQLLACLGISKFPEKTLFYFSKGMARS